MDLSKLHHVARRGLDYEGRLLRVAGATAIHMAHRVGALIVFLYVGCGIALATPWGTNNTSVATECWCCWCCC